jgi:hypothetical protein
MSNLLPLTWEYKKNSPELEAYFKQFGSKFYFTAEEINALRDSMNELFYVFQGATDFKGAIDLTTAVPTVPGYFIPTVSGTYANFGGLVVDLNNKMVTVIFDGIAFRKQEVTIDLSLYAKQSDVNLKADRVELSSRVRVKTGKNLFDFEATGILNGVYISDAGVIGSNDSYVLSGYIPAAEGQQLTKNSFFGGSVYSQFYDSRLTAIPSSQSNAQTITVPALAAYIRVSVATTSLNSYQLEVGVSSTPYVAYADLENKVGNSSIKENAISSEKIQENAISSEKIQENAITPIKTNFFEITLSSNIYNPNDVDVVTGFYLSTGGNATIQNANYKTTGFIKVTPGDIIYNGNNGGQTILRFIYGYNTSKVKVSGSEDQARTSYTVPTGVEYIRTSFIFVNNPFYQINKTAIVSYVVYSVSEKLKSIYAPPIDFSKITDNSIENSKIKDGAITPIKTNLFDASLNLFDINAVDVALAKYVLFSSGVLSANASYNATGFIPILASESYTMTYKHQIAWYNSSKVYISGSDSTDTNSTQTAPVGAAFLRCSVVLASWNLFQIVKGTSQINYVPFGFSLKETYVEKQIAKLKLGQFESKLGNSGKQVKQATLTNGSTISITDFPYHLKKGISMAISAKFATFTGSVEFGKGIGQYRGDWIKIDNTNIYWQNFESAETTKGTIAHGLTFSTFIKASLYVDDMSVAYVIVQSLNGYFRTTFNWGFEANFSPFIKTIGQDITSVVLNATSKEFQKSVWMFGDSYFGVGGGRWPGTMKTFGFLNFLINGLAGQGSTNALADLNRCLKYGTPKYIVWCLGMNDSDTVFQLGFSQLTSLCTSKGITLILATIPTVPTRNKEVITASVISSGERYVDFYNAVGANASGVWYSGYLDGDGVHPTQKGADALAMQFLIDFPELMQYGMISKTSEVVSSI